MKPFQFKYFQVDQQCDVHKVGTDAMLLGALVNHEQPRKILDVGTGTGVVALMMAQRYQGACVTGIDVQSQAAQLADKNFKNSSFADRLKAITTSIEDVNVNEKYDLIVSNPPFFARDYHSSSATRNIARHDTKFSFYLFFQTVSRVLRPTGSCTLIVPVDQKRVVREEALYHGLAMSREQVVNGKPDRPVRIVLTFIHNNYHDALETLRPLTIRDHDGHYTGDYKALTNMFHGKEL